MAIQISITSVIAWYQLKLVQFPKQLFMLVLILGLAILSTRVLISTLKHMNSVCQFFLAQKELPAEASQSASEGPTRTAPEAVKHTVVKVEGSLYSIWSGFPIISSAQRIAGEFLDHQGNSQINALCVDTGTGLTPKNTAIIIINCKTCQNFTLKSQLQLKLHRFCHDEKP